MDLLSLLPQISGLFYTIVSFVVALSVIVAVHEYGHYIVGRWSGIHAEVFSLGFGPVLWSRHDKHGTKWQIAALPFGGYVKFLGDADAASGKDLDVIEAAAADPVQLRRTMHGAPLWARAATVAAGPVFNFVMSIAVFASLALYFGMVRTPLTIGSLVPVPGVENTLRPGDELLEVGGIVLPELGDTAGWTAFREALPVTPSLDYLVRRDGVEHSLVDTHFAPAYVSSVTPRSAAADAGILTGDFITAVDGEPVFAFGQLVAKVAETKGAELSLEIMRDGTKLEMTLSPRHVDLPNPEGGFTSRWLIGIGGGSLIDYQTEPASIGHALSTGTEQVWTVIRSSISGLTHIISGAISTCNLSGPIGIAKASSDTASQGAASFIRFIAVLSTAIGLLNLFPIPALDGGHLVFYAYEAVVGRPPSDRAIQILMTAGIVMILSLMVFSLSNDIFC